MFDLSFVSKKSKEQGDKFFIAGCDEVGRGPLAGPVVAACVSIEIKNFDQKEIKALLIKWKKLGITDSKKISSKERLNILGKLSIKGLADSLSTNQIYSCHYSKNITIKILIKEIHAPVIDEINILQASLLAMREAVMDSCPLHLPGIVLIDGNKKFEYELSHVELEPVVKGDSKSLLIGLASIAAKEYHDQLMKAYSNLYPGYGWESNAGYPTKIHLQAIDELGVTEFHRLTFKGVKEIYAQRGYRGI